MSGTENKFTEEINHGADDFVDFGRLQRAININFSPFKDQCKIPLQGPGSFMQTNDIILTALRVPFHVENFWIL